MAGTQTQTASSPQAPSRLLRTYLPGKMTPMSSSKPVRVRFAPSPTGFLHVGGVRSALFNWLWAKHNDGAFVLRIEDTDQSRLVPGAADQIMESLVALGITPDESPSHGGKFGPYVQSKRLHLYSKYAAQLLENGALYRCWCSPERLTALRAEAQAKNIPFKYDRHCLVPGNQKSPDETHVLRFRIPDEPTSISWDDAVRGRLEFRLADLDDFVAIKADGFPTYQFANVVDDHLMAISHVLRADEWIPSTPKHLLVYAAFDWDPPVYAHLPAVQGPTGGKKLSKRDGAQSVEEYIAEGYLPEALMSFLASLGWNDGTTQEVYLPAELIAKFSLDHIQKSPARFDKERLTWLNGYLIRSLDPADLLGRAKPFWPGEAQGASNEYLGQVLGLIQERLKFLAELPELTEFFFVDPRPQPLLLTKALAAPVAAHALEQVLDATDNAIWDHTGLETVIRPLTETLELTTSQLFGLIRIAVTGRTAAPGLFETLEVVGRERSTSRIKSAVAALPR